MSVIDVNGDRRISAAGGYSIDNSCGDRRSQRFAVVHEPPPIDVRPADGIIARGPCITRQSLLGRRTRIASKAPIVEKEDREIGSCERVGKRSAKRAIPRVAVEHDHREFRNLRTIDEPAGQPQAIRRGKGHRLGPFQSDGVGLWHSTERKIHHPSLLTPRERDHRQKHNECDERESHSSKSIESGRLARWTFQRTTRNGAQN